MSSAPPKAGRVVTLRGLQVILSVLAGFVLLVILSAFLCRNLLPQGSPDLAKPLLGALFMLSVCEVLLLWFMGVRSRKEWRLELQSRPYKPGGALPTAYVATVVIGAALTEGLGIFGALVFVITHALPALVLSLLTLLFLVSQIPREAALLTLFSAPSTKRGSQ